MVKRPSSPKRAGSAGKPTADAVDTAPAVASVDERDTLPDKAAIEAMLLPVRLFMEAPRHSRVRGFLQRLSAKPPQVLLLEGGTEAERSAAAHYWALLLNCRGASAGSEKNAPLPLASSRTTSEPDAHLPPRTLSGSPPSLDLPFMPLLPGVSTLPPELPSPGAAASGASFPAPPQPLSGASRFDESALCDSQPEQPCLNCPECVRMVTHLHRDCFFLDGLAASIKIDEVRAVRAVLGEPPREARFRMIIFREAQALVEAAANALLKSFEEPRPATAFVMLAPQRERLLPTLVSRSTVLTLPWPTEEDPAAREALAPWEAALCAFAETGRGWFERTGNRGAVDAPLAHAIAGLCRRALAARMLGLHTGQRPAEGLEAVFARLPEPRLRMLDEVLAECQDSLIYNVNPTLVLEWLATRLHLLLPR